MEFQRTQTVSRPPANIGGAPPFKDADDGGHRERLNALLAMNAEIYREKSLYRSNQEEAEAVLMKNPLSTKNAFAYFGLMLGTFPPAAMFIKVVTRGGEEVGLFVLLFFVNLICAIAGYFSGKLIGAIVSDLEKRSWTLMLIALPFVGALWGLITGAAGGLLIFVIGALFGAIVAAVVGSIAIPAFAIFHRLLKSGEMIDRNHFLPVALGIILAISAFILGL